MMLHGGRTHGFPLDGLHGRGRVLPQTRRVASPRWAGLPRVRSTATPGGPPPPPGASPGLPVRRLWPGLQRLDRDHPAGDAPPPLPDPAVLPFLSANRGRKEVHPAEACAAERWMTIRSSDQFVSRLVDRQDLQLEELLVAE